MFVFANDKAWVLLLKFTEPSYFTESKIKVQLIILERTPSEVYKSTLKGLVIGLCNCGTPAGLVGLDIDLILSFLPTAPLTCGTLLDLLRT